MKECQEVVLMWGGRSNLRETLIQHCDGAQIQSIQRRARTTQHAIEQPFVQSLFGREKAE